MIILGAVGDNFGAGMSGGIAYLADTEDNRRRVNQGLVDILEPTQEEQEWLDGVIAEHIARTGSTTTLRGANLIKIMPRDYAKVLAVIAAAEAEGRNVNEAIMEAVN